MTDEDLVSFLNKHLVPTLQAWMQAEKSRTEIRERMLSSSEVCATAAKLILLYRTEAPKAEIEEATKEYEKAILRANMLL